MNTKTSAPSNIALIKYMGKIEGLGNKPTNASLSWTLENLRSEVEINLSSQSDFWTGRNGFEMKPAGVEKFIKHFQFLKSKWQIDSHFQISSSNNFPSDCGLASSASSFAALTLAAAQLFQKIKPQPWGEDLSKLSELSRQGSGSSCRSFFSPWALWRNEGAEKVQLPLRFHHAVVVLESGPKKVSSSEAHKRVVSSPAFIGRIKRAEDKLEELLSAINRSDWKLGYEIVWDEFEDMHQLFHTSIPPFGYITKEAREMLDWCRQQWKREGAGPWVTLDAGPNIHFLFEESDLQFAKRYLQAFSKQKVITSWAEHR